MEVMIPIHEQDMDDFDFNSARSSPYPTAPSTPRGFGNYYTSAPTTPSRLSAFYQEFDDFNISDTNNNGYLSYYYDDFAFGAVHEETNNNNVVATAADLFEGGIIKPINNKPPIPPPRRDNNRNNPISSEVQLMEDKLATKRGSRGRERSLSIASSSSSKRGTRSLSPKRVSKHAWVEIEEAREEHPHHNNKQSPSVAKPSSNKSHRKWRFRDLFLFRSASEGRASEKDNLKKYSLFSSSRRRMQDKENRGAKEEMKNKHRRSFWNNGFHGNK